MRNAPSSPRRWSWALAFVLWALLVSSASAASYLDDTTPDLARLLPPPPANDSAQTRRELDELLQLQHDRTPKDVEYARANISIGIEQFASVLGDEAEIRKSLPASVKSLFEATRKDENTLLSAAKRHFDRPRPIALDPRIQPVLEPIVNLAYPSGHATWVFMTAVLLADMVPERRAAIWERAEDFARQRMVGGVHYRSDIDSGRLAGTVVAAYLLANPRYRADAAVAGAELRTLLKLPPLEVEPAKAASATRPQPRESRIQVLSTLEPAGAATLTAPLAR
jgi:acid phosphatase (class A)